MANMLNKSAPYLLNMRCPCPRCVSGPDRRIERRVARRKEARAWRRDYEAGEFSDDTRYFSWWHDLMGEIEYNDPHWQEVAGQYKP